MKARRCVKVEAPPPSKHAKKESDTTGRAASDRQPSVSSMAKQL